MNRQDQGRNREYAPRAPFSRLRDRSDSELEQASIRLGLGVLTCAYLLTLDLSGEQGHAARMMLWTISFFLSGSVLLLGAILIRPEPSPARRFIGICVDLCATSVAMGVAGESGSPLLAIYLWVILGNGFRYGIRYLLMATCIGLIGFLGVFLLSDFWGRHPVFSISFMIVLMLIPAYVAALLDKLNHAIRQANDANEAKSRFLAKMSHELRTPLNGVIGMADLLMDSRLEPQQESFARTIQCSATTLLGIIENILDISKIEAGRIAIEFIDFDLHRLVADTVHMFKPQARRRDLDLILHIDPHVPFLLRGDPLHLRQILLNLLGNAVKFTEKGSVQLRIEVLDTPRDDGMIGLRFEIEDTGIGIAPEEQPHVFESFRQAESSTSRRYGGTGLGTAIARELALLMGGNIGLRSDLGKGTLFWVELPFLPQSEAGIQGDGDLRKARVLLVGEEETRLVRILSEWDIELSHADSCATALIELRKAAQAGRPFNALLGTARDLDSDPRKLAAAVRAETRFDGTALVLLDATPAFGSDASLLQAGYCAVLQAPLDRTQLFNSLHAAVSAQEVPDDVLSLADHYDRLSSRPGQGLHILVAEDNQTNRKVLQGILERVGHRVTLANDGESALDELLSDGKDFDLMILDKNMPERSGLEVFKAYQFMASGDRIPGIILTADATPDALAACNEAGVNAYLTKPVDTRKLLETIARLCDRPLEPTPRETGMAPPAKMRNEEEDEALMDEDKLQSLVRLGEGSQFYDELVTGFLDDSQRSLEWMADAIEERDYPDLRKAIHALRGSSGEIGATRITRLCVEMRGLKPFELNSPRAQEILDRLRQSREETSRFLRAFPQTVVVADPLPPTRGPWPDAVNEKRQPG